MLEQSRLKELLSYNPITGKFFRVIGRKGGGSAGSEAGYDGGKGYLKIRIDGREYYCHRLAWLYVHGEFPCSEIDHINRDKLDNRLINLRAVSHVENMKNKSAYKNNTSGVLGVCWNKNAKKWRATITADGKNNHLGYYDDLELATLVRHEAESHYNYYPNHGRV